MTWLRTLIAWLLCASLAAAEDWPQWLGPQRNGVSTEKIAPWKQVPKVLWRQPIGEGNSGPVVAHGRVFLHAKVKDKNEEEVFALDAETGDRLWQRTYSRAAFKSFYGNGPRATPAVSAGKLYTFGITGVLTCYDAEKGKQLWQVDTLEKLQAKNLFFGMACSPLVEGDKVLVNVGGKGAAVVALDKTKGDVIWKNLDDGASYSSPIIFGEGKERQAVFLTQQSVVGLSPGDGSLLWRIPLKDELLESSTTPALCGHLLMASSITFGSVGLKLATMDDKPGANQLWKNPALTCYFATPVPVGTDHLYVVTGTKPPAVFSQATLHCIDAKTGKDLCKTKVVGKYHATLLRTGDDKLLMLEEAGNLVLLDPDPTKGLPELARARVCGQTWAHPAISNGRIYIRDDKEVLCLQFGE
jgi:outer membrane protein assembly factor BamB